MAKGGLGKSGRNRGETQNLFKRDIITFIITLFLNDQVNWISKLQFELKTSVLKKKSPYSKKA